jgi:hypothetical protein
LKRKTNLGAHAALMRTRQLREPAMQLNVDEGAEVAGDQASPVQTHPSLTLPKLLEELPNES